MNKILLKEYKKNLKRQNVRGQQKREVHWYKHFFFLKRNVQISSKKNRVQEERYCFGLSLASPDTVDRFKLGISKASGSQREENPGQPRILHAYSLPESFVNF